MQKSYSNEEKKLLLQVGNNIRKFRNKVGLSQEKLAFASNLDRTYIGSIERGERNISIINLTKIADALNIDSYEILKFEE